MIDLLIKPLGSEVFIEDADKHLSICVISEYRESIQLLRLTRFGCMNLLIQRHRILKMSRNKRLPLFKSSRVLFVLSIHVANQAMNSRCNRVSLSVTA